ncbi:MAG: sugar ABC transporter substrate-binding protein [Eubacteriales bacterium]
MSIKKKIIITILSIFLISSAFTGCKELVLEPPIIGVSTSDTIGMTEKIVNDITAMAKEDGYSLTVSNASGNYNAQTSQITALIAEGVNVLAICPVNEAKLAASLEAAAAAEIPVIIFERPLENSTGIASTIGYDATGEGKAAAQAIAENDNGKSNVVIEIVGPEDNPNAVAASKGFHEVIDLVDNITVVKVYSEWSPNLTVSGLTSVLTRYPDASAIYNSNSTLDTSISEVLDTFGLNEKTDAAGHIYRVSVSGSKNGYTSAVEGYVDVLIVTQVDDLSAALYDALVTLGSGKTPEETEFTASYKAIPQASVQSSQASIWGFVFNIE